MSEVKGGTIRQWLYQFFATLNHIGVPIYYLLPSRIFSGIWINPLNLNAMATQRWQLTDGLSAWKDRRNFFFIVVESDRATPKNTKEFENNNKLSDPRSTQKSSTPFVPDTNRAQWKIENAQSTCNAIIFLDHFTFFSGASFSSPSCTTALVAI